VNKAQLLEAVAKDSGASKARAAEMLDAVLGAVSKELKKDGTVQLVGFGTFNVRSRKARTGRNPQTGAKINIKASKTVGFRPGKSLKKLL
jgi:DNA-binding protein HU-beta